MLLSTGEALVIIGLLSLGTMITRFLPFILFPAKAVTPKYVVYLGKMLPPAAISLLVVYCLRYLSFTVAPHGIPEFISISVVAGLHIWKNNTLLSIAAGTAVYMLLIQFVF